MSQKGKLKCQPQTVSVLNKTKNSGEGMKRIKAAPAYFLTETFL